MRERSPSSSSKFVPHFGGVSLFNGIFTKCRVKGLQNMIHFNDNEDGGKGLIYFILIVITSSEMINFIDIDSFGIIEQISHDSLHFNDHNRPKTVMQQGLFVSYSPSNKIKYK